jgi:DNA-binding response OmpR family regulator
LLSSRDASAREFVRALHQAAIAVLERDITTVSLSMARSGEFDIVAVVEDGELTAQHVAELGQSHVPTLVLMERVAGPAVSAYLTAGADACLELAADADLVIAQVHAILRRRMGPPPGTVEDGALVVGDLVVDTHRCELTRGGRNIALTPTEFRIIEFMARNAGRVLHPHAILNAISDDYRYLPREAHDVFKVYVRRIRRKLEESEGEPLYLVTVRGFGYRLDGHSGAANHRLPGLAAV